ncbi:MAG: ATP-dependent helicase, partial [Clostridium sp.]
EKMETYIHRIGRTGRAGEEGYTCLFVDPKDSRLLGEIEREIKFTIPRRYV